MKRDINLTRVGPWNEDSVLTKIMMRKRPCLWISLLAASCSLCMRPALARDETYDLRTVKGIEAFSGSAAARELLGKNGFVVADPAFKQIFEPYIKSSQTEEPSEKNPMGRSLPSFITADSAWHTYHVLLEEGVKGMEEIQSRRLLDFSRRLLAVASDPKIGNSNLVLFASVGLALQDEHYRQSLAPELKRIVDGLRTGSTPVEMPVGFPLSPLQFRAQSFYTQSPELSDYFAARQWYASVVFRLSNARETQSAVALAALVNGNAELLTLWKQLSDPLDAFLASAEDGTIRDYADAAKVILGTNNWNGSGTDRQIAEIQKRLEGQLPLPRVSDQLLSPEQYAEFSKQTRGFRLLPPRRLPCAVCFHDTVDPKIPGRMYPSGLDFLAASPVLHSPAAVRAVQSQFGKSVSDLILKADCGPMPDSLHGEAMQLLSTLQKPLLAQAPPSMRNEAWSDLQLWTQLGAWAEQRHTWALHTKLSVMYMGMISPPKGMVAPYPDFFAGLAKLTRRTAEAFDKAGLEQRFEVKTVASELLELLDLFQKLSSSRDEKEFEKLSGKLEQLGQFQNHYYEKHRAELEKDRSRDSYKKLEKELEDLARRCAANGTTNEADIETLRSFFECRQNITRLLNDFAPVCDRLAELAKKSLTGETLTEDDGKWIENYGVTLAGFHFYYGNSYEVPRDDFPIVTRVFSSPLTSSMLYAGLARPQALYLIIPDGNSKQLYRGAVMTYREFVRPNSQLLDDESWRELVSKGQTPPAPPFTRSFYAETSVRELIKRLRAQSENENANYGDIEDILWQIGSRATEKDLPDLLEVLTHTKADEHGDIVDGIAEIIAKLPWESHQKQLIELLAAPDNALADASARILVERPEVLDTTLLISSFSHQPPRTRRLYCAILSRLPQQTDAIRKLFLKALNDRADGVRWQAALAIGKTNASQSDAALLETLNDTNEMVAAAAVYSLAKLGATNTAPVLFAKLKTRLQSTNASPEELERQASEIARDMRGGENQAKKILDPDRLELRFGIRVPARAKQMASRRLPPRPISFPTHDYNLADALIEALGDLGYTPAADELFKLRGTDYDAETTRALSKLASDRLTGELLVTAKDKQVDSYVRERAMVTLCNISATNHVRDLIPLLDDATPIVYERTLPGPEWRVCDRAAETIAILLGWENGRSPIYIRPEQRGKTMNRVRDWAKQAQ
jgi:HEAT repeat protein